MSNSKTTVASLEARVIELETAMINALKTIAELQASPKRGARDYGPNSQTAMTSLMAWRIRYGDLVGTPVKTIADENGLSRGQVYSVRGNYTFTAVTADSFRFEEGEDAVTIVEA